MGATSSRRLTRPFALLEDRCDPLAPARLYRHARSIVSCNQPDDLEGALAKVERALSRGFHAVGFCAYELGYVLEPKLRSLLPPSRSVPLLWFAMFDPPRLAPQDRVDEFFARLGPPPPLTELAFGHTREDHEQKVSRLLDLIEAGDLYQANLTFPISFRFTADPFRLYGALRARQPVSHGGFIGLGEASILSVSPEMFVRIERDRITTRPMKGTAPRASASGDDEAAKADLLSDPKQRAENLMIVDLMRNDLAKLAKPGTVKVPALFEVETYPNFHTLTSTITAELEPERSLADRLRALFPCGSIVGAPKVRAAEVISLLEDGPRGVYTGAIGVIRPGLDMDFNVAIRTAWIGREGDGRYGVGGGVVADSIPSAEFDEALLKGRTLTQLAADYSLIETLRWVAGQGFVRRDDHLRRLADSAARLGFKFSRSDTEGALAKAEQAWKGDQRVRLVLARTGEVEITTTPAPPPSDAPARLHVSRIRLDRADPFLRHKTTVRVHYDQALAEARDRGCDEALMLNREGDLADGSYTTLFAKTGERLLTPPISSGALPGILRASLLASGVAAEARLTPKMVLEAEQLFIGNSLRGLGPAVLGPSAFVD